MSHVSGFPFVCVFLSFFFFFFHSTTRSAVPCLLRWREVPKWSIVGISASALSRRPSSLVSRHLSRSICFVLKGESLIYTPMGTLTWAMWQSKTSMNPIWHISGGEKKKPHLRNIFKKVLICSIPESLLVLSLPKLQHLLSEFKSVLLILLFFYCLNAVFLGSVFLQDDCCLVHVINAKLTSPTDAFLFVCFTFRGVQERCSFTWKCV